MRTREDSIEMLGFALLVLTAVPTFFSFGYLFAGFAKHILWGL